MIGPEAPLRAAGLLMVAVATLSTAGSGRAAAELAAPGQEGNPLARVESFVVYFGDTFHRELGCYDMAIIDPDAHTPAEVAELRDGGTLTMAYLSVGEAETYRWFYPRVDPSWMLGPNPDWENHFFVDARKEGWQTLLLHTVIPRIVERGYEGLFLDMVDTALPGLYPETADGMVELIHRIRAEHPRLLLIMNRGFFVAHRVADVVEGLAVEGIFSRYDFADRTYGRTPPDRRDALLRDLDHAVESHGFAPFLIDYAPMGDPGLGDRARAAASRRGLPSFVSTIALDRVPASPSGARLEGCPTGRGEGPATGSRSGGGP
jgi:hypothetical protein